MKKKAIKAKLAETLYILAISDTALEVSLAETRYAEVRNAKLRVQLRDNGIEPCT